ncbi:MAG: fatty acid desaturase [Proteobacteria bacterium]|nr:fatty acid desaturase [Pseudomonadota bacterium]
MRVALFMASPDSSSPAAYRNRGGLDVRSCAVVAAEWLGLVLAFEGHRRGWLPAPLAAVIGLASLNLAFTVWHEGIHQTLARHRGLNHALGRLAAVPVVIPYDRLRVHHLLHHRYTNDPARDPDHWQLRGSLWTLPFRLRAGEREARALCEAEDPACVRSAGDRIQLAATGLLLLTAFWASPWSLVFAWLAPRAALVYVHAAYVNYLPHVGLPADRWAGARFLWVPDWLSRLMVRHNYHALHHAYPSIPWHRYREAYPALASELEAHGVSALSGRQSLRLLNGGAS